MNPLAEKMARYQTPQVIKKNGYYPYFRPIQSEQAPEILINDRKVVMLGSNSYLGLTNHPKIKEASKNAIDKYGTGCAGSRFLNGTLDLHLELESRLAAFVGKPNALVFSTGYQVNIGVLSSLLDRNDKFILDELDHACIIDGVRLSFADSAKFKHNNMESLESCLQRCKDDAGIKVIIIDGVFSMEGDIAKLDEIVALAKKYNASVMVDDAHGIGVLGPKGQGTSSHFQLTDDVDLIMGTFSKSLASIGGFIAADEDTINYLKHNARSLIFSASISPSNAASVITALDIIESEPERLDRLWENTNFFKTGLKSIGFDLGDSESPIIPLYIRDNIATFKMASLLLEENLFVNPIVSPAVKSTNSLIRLSLMATHTMPQLEMALDKIEKVARKLGILNIENEVA